MCLGNLWHWLGKGMAELWCVVREGGWHQLTTSPQGQTLSVLWEGG